MYCDKLIVFCIMYWFSIILLLLFWITISKLLMLRMVYHVQDKLNQEVHRTLTTMIKIFLN